VTQRLEVLAIPQMREVLSATGKIVIDAEHVMTLAYEALAQM
jgi:hypothetical protein